MTEQIELFPDPATTIEVDTSRAEPALWVRRLLIWERPSDPPFRSIEFRRGLNILWSPDPGAKDAKVGESSGSGHGAGKSLMCRLLRYCLGEETYALAKVRRRINKEFAEGVVGIELVLSGETWGVVRWLGNAGKAIVGEHRQPEELLEKEPSTEGMAPLLKALQAALQTSLIEPEMPGELKWGSWFMTLAWMARDQECRFDHSLSWRHKATDSRPSLLERSNEELLVAVRLLLKAIDTDELRLKEKRGAVIERAKTLSKRMEHLEWTIDQMASELLPALGIDAALLGSKELGERAIQRAAEEKLRAVEAELALGEDDPNVSSLRSEREAVVGKIEATRAKLEITQGEFYIYRDAIAKNAPEAVNSKEEEKEDALKTCPFCGAPLDREEEPPANVVSIFAAIEETDPGPKVAEAIFTACSACASAARSELNNLRRNLTELEANRDRLARELKERQAEARARMGVKLRRFQEVDREVSAAAQLEARRTEIVEIKQRIDDLETQRVELKAAIAEARTQHRAAIARLEELFRYVCRGLLGAGIDASLTLDGKGLQTSVEVGGAAMDSVQAIAFDLAAMLMSVEGRTHLPAFLIHDSPRATDLGLSVYHRLLRFGALLESSLRGRPFQYILTTTTEPPGELRDQAVVEVLSGFVDSERLLRQKV